MKACSVVCGDRSRRWLSSVVPRVRPLRPPGDMVGDGGRFGDMGGSRRGGLDNMVTVLEWKEQGVHVDEEGAMAMRWLRDLEEACLLLLL